MEGKGSIVDVLVRVTLPLQGEDKKIKEVVLFTNCHK